MILLKPSQSTTKSLYSAHRGQVFDTPIFISKDYFLRCLLFIKGSKKLQTWLETKHNSKQTLPPDLKLLATAQ